MGKISLGFWFGTFRALVWCLFIPNIWGTSLWATAAVQYRHSDLWHQTWDVKTKKESLEVTWSFLLPQGWIMPGACSWRPPAFPCGIPCPVTLRASVALVVLPSLPWNSPHACPWARDFYFSLARGCQSLPHQCCGMPGSRHSHTLLGHIPSWSQSVPASRLDLGPAASSGPPR